MKSIKSTITIQGECDVIKQSMESDGLLAGEKSVQNINLVLEGKFEQDDFDTLNIGIYNGVNDLSNNDVSSNTDFVCLIGIDLDLSDKFLLEYGGYVFRFDDNESCIAFLKGLCYVRHILDFPDYYLHDMYVLLGHKLEIDKQIGAFDLLKRIDTKKLSSIIAFVFSKHPDIRAKYIDRVQELSEESPIASHIYQSEFEFVSCLALQ